MFGNRGSRTKQRNNAKLKKEKRDSPKQRWGKENRNGMTSALQDFYAGRTFEGKLDRQKKRKRKQKPGGLDSVCRAGQAGGNRTAGFTGAKCFCSIITKGQGR